METDPKEVARHSMEIWNSRQPEATDSLFAPNFVQHDPQNPFPVEGPKGYKQFMQHYLNAFPDLHLTIEAIVADGQMTVTRWTAIGTHRGDLPNVRATGRHVTVTGMTCSRIQNGKIVENWNNWDTLGMLQQLGVVPALPVTKAA